MYFTTMDSLKEIMAYPNMKNWIRFLFLKDTYGFFPQEYAHLPLRATAFLGKTSWGDDLRGVCDQLVDTANLVVDLTEGRKECLRLSDFTDWAPGDEDDTNASTFLITPGKHPVDKEQRPAMVICPGGAYSFVSFQNEGTPIADLATKKGYRCFMLNYRTASHATYPNPQMDLLHAIAYVRDHAEEYGVDPKRVIAVGFSAGGHLVASTAGVAEELLPEGKPDAVVLGYPVITLQDTYTHQETKENLVGMDDDLKNRLSAERQVDATYPPTFAWACEDDDCVPSKNTTFLKEALEVYDVPQECHIYPWGGHGCGLAFGNSAYGWSEVMFAFLDQVL